MIAAPAVDLRKGRCVQLVGGRPEEERVSLPDPIAVARGWREMGFRTLHFVDLDAALSDGDNRALLGELVRDAREDAESGGESAVVETIDSVELDSGEAVAADLGKPAAGEAGASRAGELGASRAGEPGASRAGEARRTPVIQVGGGVRDDEAAVALLDAGVDRVIVGTRAVDDPEWLAALAAGHPGRIMVAADLRDGMVLRRGWTEASELAILDFLEQLNAHPLAGVLCTDVAKEGRLAGIDLPQSESLVRASRHPIWISGGIHSMRDLHELEASGAAGVVLGMALYTGALDGRTVAREFGS